MSDMISPAINSMYLKQAVNDAGQSSGKLENSLSSKDLSTASDDELMSVCKKFESYFVEQVFKAMDKMVPKEEGESSSTNSLKDYYKDEMISQYATDASKSNGGKGFGIAQQLYEQMKRNYSSDLV